MPLKKLSFLKSLLTPRLQTAYPVLALTACLAAAGAQAADQGPRHHAQGQYDTVTATYGVVEGDELVVISERFQVPVGTLKAQNNLPSDEIRPGQKLAKLAIAANTSSPASSTGGKPNILFIMGMTLAGCSPAFTIVA